MEDDLGPIPVPVDVEHRAETTDAGGWRRTLCAVSRTRRAGPVEGFWATVDEWAAEVVDPSRVRGWWASRCRPRRRERSYLDVTGELVDRHRPLREAVAATGVALPDDPELRARLVETGVEHRRITAARRYRWNGPALTPVVLELHTTEDEAVLETWWEDVWAAWPTIRLGQESASTKPPRRATATAQVNRLFAALGLDPLGRAPDDRPRITPTGGKTRSLVDFCRRLRISAHGAAPARRSGAKAGPSGGAKAAVGSGAADAATS